MNRGPSPKSMSAAMALVAKFGLGKALLRAIVENGDVLRKSAPSTQEFLATTVHKVEPVRDFNGEISDAATLIKAAHRAGAHPRF